MDLKSIKAKEIKQLSQTSPNWWIKEVLGDKAWRIQRDIARSIRDNFETNVASCHGAGKSWLAARVALWFLYSFYPSIVITTAPTDRQVRRILWKEITTAHNNAKMNLEGRLLTQNLEIQENWFAIGFTSKDYQSQNMQGWHEKNILVVVDEACGVSKDVMEGLDGVLSSENARKLSIGNPVDPMSPFAQDFKRKGPKCFNISVYDTPNFTAFGITEKDIINNTWEKKITGPLPNAKLVTPYWVYKMAHKWGFDSPSYQAKIKGMFPEEGTDTMFPLAWITAAQERSLNKSEPIRIGADIARFGDDTSVIGARWGNVYRELECFSKQDTMQTTGMIIKTRKKIGASISNVDGDGLGAGVIDRLNEQNDPVFEIRGASEPRDKETYPNYRCELYGNMRDRFNPENAEIDIDPNDEDLVAELNQIKYKIDSRGRITVEPKEQMKKRIKISPDKADCLVYTFAEPKERKRIIMV